MGLEGSGAAVCGTRKGKGHSRKAGGGVEIPPVGQE